jgi:hypothetical protein
MWAKHIDWLKVVLNALYSFQQQFHTNIAQLDKFQDISQLPVLQLSLQMSSDPVSRNYIYNINTSTNVQCLYLMNIILRVQFCVIMPNKQMFKNSYYAIMEDRLEARGTCTSNN